MTENGQPNPSGELWVLLEAQALVERGEAEWSDAELEFSTHVEKFQAADPPARCHLCQIALGADHVVTPNGLLWCRDLEACKRRAGVRMRREGSRKLACPPIVSLGRPRRPGATPLEELPPGWWECPCGDNVVARPGRATLTGVVNSLMEPLCVACRAPFREEYRRP